MPADNTQSTILYALPRIFGVTVDCFASTVIFLLRCCNIAPWQPQASGVLNAGYMQPARWQAHLFLLCFAQKNSVPAPGWLFVHRLKRVDKTTIEIISTKQSIQSICGYLNSLWLAFCLITQFGVIS